MILGDPYSGLKPPPPPPPARGDPYSGLILIPGSTLPEKLQLARALACGKGASSWLTTLPLKVHGFQLPKGLFRDALCLRYGGQVPQLSTTCACGSAMEVKHALSCRFSGLPIRRHNEVRNLLASCLRKAGCDTTIEPLLQPRMETLHGAPSPGWFL